MCIDIQSAVEQVTGVGRYTRLLVQHLGAAAEGHELSVFSFDFKRRGIPFATPNADQRFVRWLPGRLAARAWRTLGWPPFDLLAGKADLYHFPNFVLPPLRAGASAVTIHDLSFIRHPEFAEEANRRYLTATIRDTVARADAVMTDSQFSADEICSVLKVAQDRVFPIHLGIDGRFTPPAANNVAEALARMDLTSPYLLTVGTVEPRKNLPFLVDVFERLTEFDGCLVIAGMLGWKTEPILERIRRSTRAADIRVLDYAADTDLPALYAGAELFLTTSFYEGFGFTPLEAMACGTPVVSSNGGSLGEVLGDAAVVVDGFDPEEWVDHVRAALTDTPLRERLKTAGRAKAAGYTWERTAQRTWDVYREVAG